MLYRVAFSEKNEWTFVIDPQNFLRGKNVSAPKLIYSLKVFNKNNKSIRVKL